MKVLLIALVFAVSHMLFSEYIRYKCGNPNSIDHKMIRRYYAGAGCSFEHEILVALKVPQINSRIAGDCYESYEDVRLDLYSDSGYVSNSMKFRIPVRCTKTKDLSEREKPAEAPIFTSVKI